MGVVVVVSGIVDIGVVCGVVGTDVVDGERVDVVVDRGCVVVDRGCVVVVDGECVVVIVVDGNSR